MRRIAYPLLAAAALLISGLTAMAQKADSEKITTLLQHAKEHAAAANLDAEKIESYTRSNISWKTHSYQLMHMRDDINALGKDAAALTEARDEGSAWQQEAIDDINPLLRSMADHLTAMINHLNDNQGQVHMPPFRDYAKANYTFSQKTLDMIRDYVDYAESKAKSEALEQKLLVPQPASSGQ